jgi:nucleoporin POM152
MSETPNLKSGFPRTPATQSRRRNQIESPSTNGSPLSSRGGLSSSRASNKSSAALPLAPENVPTNTNNEPVIPLTLLDAPQQRLYAVGVYVLLWAWKLYDWLQVIEDGDVSWWLFIKWIFIDFAFLFAIPELRIPWLELSQTAVISAFSVHLVVNYMLMFNIPLPWQSALLGFAKVLYDREISISEHNVKVSSILNNHSLIMGKQIINILPEGSAVLNPDNTPFCLSSRVREATLPIFFNATVPAEIELIRIDLDTEKPESIKVSNRDIKKLAKQIREHNSDPTTAAFPWEYPVKKSGIYRLGKVLDEYKLEVQRTAKDTYVVPCPEARFKTSDSPSRCIRDLSDLSLEVLGTPPLKISYNRTINKQASTNFNFQSLQPDEFTSPLLGNSQSVVSADSTDVSWVRPSKVTVGLNESMYAAGDWEYSIHEVRDAFDNVVTYGEIRDDPDKPVKPSALVKRFFVRERPRVRLDGCNLQKSLRAPKDYKVDLPVAFSLSSRPDDTSHSISYDFSPIDSLTSGGDHGSEVKRVTFDARNSHDKPKVSEPGLYTLRSVSSGSCGGEVDEPSSCLLVNPIEPDLTVRYEEIPDKCAGNSIGLRVDLDLVGSPPFRVYYDIYNPGSSHPEPHHKDVTGLREQIELIPKNKGHYRYVFKSITDAVYTGLHLSGPDKHLEQVVKPAASAWFDTERHEMSACLDSEVEIPIILNGDAPFNLEWELVHEGKRRSERVNNIETNKFTIKTSSLIKGGDYVLALSSVQDKRGCRTFLQRQMKISVRQQRPRAGFELVEQRNSIMAVEDSPLHLAMRLHGGEAPWTVSYRNLNGSDRIVTKTLRNNENSLVVKERGIYQLVSVTDRECPGRVDPPMSTFQVDWYPLPDISLIETESITPGSGSFIKKDVCEGDIDGFELSLKGLPPFRVQYDIKHKPIGGTRASIRKDFFDVVNHRAPIEMNTAKPGEYTYTYSDLSDALYDKNKRFSPLVVQQRVNAKPSAAFAKPGQSFKFCAEEQEQEDSIPITLTGVAPFYVEVEIKHQAGAPVETYRIPSINTKTFSMQIPRQHLRLGSQQVRIRTVRDARGCQQKYELNGPSVQIQVYDAPSIYPLESRQDYCVGERIAYTLSGTPPFDIAYNFNGKWHAKSQTTSFRRIAEKPGDFVITSISDKASECRAAVNIQKTIHPLPSVQISKGRQSRVDIHEGNEVEIQFDFWGTPPFEFTYTRSSNAKKGQKSIILETRHDISYEHSKVVKASQEGTYEVVAIKDKFCSFSTQQVEKRNK